MILSIDWQINFVGLDMNWRNVSSNEDLCFSLCGAYAASVFFYMNFFLFRMISCNIIKSKVINFQNFNLLIYPIINSLKFSKKKFIKHNLKISLFSDFNFLLRIELAF